MYPLTVLCSIESFNLKIESLRQKRIKSLSNCNICKLPENRTYGGPCYFSNTYKNWNGLILKKE